MGEQRLAHRLAPRRVVHREVDRALAHADRLRGDRRPRAVEGHHRDLEAVALAPSRFSCGTSTSSNFGAPSFQPGIPIVRSGSALSPGESPSTTNALMPPAPVVAGAREHDVGVGVARVADEALLAVEHPRVAVALGARLQRRRVGADRRLGQRVGAVALAADQRREARLLLLLAARDQDRQRHELHVRRHQRDRAGDLRQLLDVGAPRHLGRVAPAVLGRQREPHQPLARQRLVDVVRVVAVLVHLAHARADLLEHDAADVLAQLALLIGQTPHVLPLSDGIGAAGARASRAADRATRCGASRA